MVGSLCDVQCDGESLCSCGIVVVRGYVCSGDSVRCSMVVVGGYGCSGDSECYRGGGVVIL